MLENIHLSIIPERYWENSREFRLLNVTVKYGGETFGYRAHMQVDELDSTFNQIMDIAKENMYRIIKAKMEEINAS